MNTQPEVSALIQQSLSRDWLQSLTAESTLIELPAHEATVNPEVLTSAVDRELGNCSDLPGVVIATENELLGMISRPMLLAQLSRPFGQELYLKRPIRLLLEAERSRPLVLPCRLLVGDAAHAALQRPAESVYEPVVVECEQRFRLLDVHTLLIAQSRLLALANEKIRSQAETADAANRAKSVFLANMSHEIRTPLTAILGFAENLMDVETSTGERTAAVETILRNGHHLLQLINDILDLSKIEAGRLETESLRFSPGDLLADVISALRARSDAKRIGLNLIYENAIPDTIESDPTRLRQILMNLISNAIKFTDRGQVVVKLAAVNQQGAVTSKPAVGDPLRVRCHVSDSGIGISPEQLNRLFSPFVQADESTTRRFGGTGLGLSISRKLAQLLGGDISVTSRPDVGSTFTLEVAAGSVVDMTWHLQPSTTGKLTSKTAAAPERRLDIRILLAEDGPDNQLLIGAFLQKQGAEVIVVDNGQQALETALASLEEGRPFEVILMDMQMPVLDGYSATRELRAHGWTRPILALTANAMQGDRQKCLEAGCDDFCTKPINRSHLIERIQAFSVSDEAAPTRTPLAVPASVTRASFDRDAALERVGGEADLLREIAGMIAEIGPAWLNDLQRHLSERDISAARRVAHSLKNSAENLACHGASQPLSRLEIAAAETHLDEAILLWPECRERFGELLHDVQLYLRSFDSAAKTPCSAGTDSV